MTPTCFDAMIDLEFMSPDNDGAIVAIGVHMFDLATETIGASFSKNVHLATSMRDGGTCSASTILFWLRQSDNARSRVFNGGLDIRDVLRDLAVWMGLQCGQDENGVPLVRPWGNSAKTDLGILESAYKRAHIPVPWFWSRERCFRTVRNQHPGVEYNVEEKGDGAHDPLVDCRFQIQHLLKIKRAVQAAKAVHA